MHRHDPNEDSGVVDEYSRRDKLQRRRMQIDYLRNCREEQVLPPSAPKLLKGKVGDHPFPASSREFLTERIEQHRNDISLLTEQAKGVHLPHRLVIKLQKSKTETEARLQQNLERTCNRS